MARPSWRQSWRASQKHSPPALHPTGNSLCASVWKPARFRKWIVRGLAQHGLTAVLMETRQVRAALKAMITKTDRGDARGMAHLLWLGWFQRALLTARSVLLRRLRDLEN